MARAFTKESDNENLQDPLPKLIDVLPLGVKNYITQSGAKSMKARLNHLVHVERVRAQKAVKEDTDRTIKQKLQHIDQEILILNNRIANFEIVDPAKQNGEHVAFGAKVAVAEENGKQRTYTICGIDETDPEQGKISWISPIAKALQGKRIGDEAAINLPHGRKILEILTIEYC